MGYQSQEFDDESGDLISSDEEDDDFDDVVYDEEDAESEVEAVGFDGDEEF